MAQSGGRQLNLLCNTSHNHGLEEQTVTSTVPAHAISNTRINIAQSAPQFDIRCEHGSTGLIPRWLRIPPVTRCLGQGL